LNRNVCFRVSAEIPIFNFPFSIPAPTLASCMRRSIVAGLSLCVLLASCGRGTRATYQLTFNTEDASRLSELSLAVTRVVERMLESMGEEVRGLDIAQRGAGPELSFTTETAAAAELLREDLTTPFTLTIMRESKQSETPTVSIDAHGGFMETGIHQGHLEWVIASEEPDNRGRITLQFNADGRELMRKVFKQNVGKNIGIFVRGNLVAKLQVDTAELKDDIIITGIPTVALARVFADDVNVGLHVQFTPLP